MANKPKATREAPPVRKSRRSHAAKHGRTFCARCTRKIARGMQFCNEECFKAFTG